MRWSGRRVLLLCAVTRLEAVNQLTGEICADTPGTLCYGSMRTAGGDESSQNKRGEHHGLFLVSVVLLNLCNLSEGDRKAQRLYPVLPGGSCVYSAGGTAREKCPMFPCQANETKRDLIRDELCSAMVMRGSTK